MNLDSRRLGGLAVRCGQGQYTRRYLQNTPLCEDEQRFVAPL